MEGFRYRVRQAGTSPGVTVLDAEGALDSYTCETLQLAFKRLFDDGSCRVVMNLQGLQYLSSAGIGLLIEQMEIARSRHGDIKLVHVPPKIEKVLDMCGATKLLEVFKDEDAALQSFTSSPSRLSASPFPREAACPACGHQAQVPSPDVYKCLKCGEVFYLDPEGAVHTLKKAEGEETKSLTRKVELNIQSDLNLMQSVKMFVKDVVVKDGFDEETALDIELAVDEALTNVVEHAYQFDDSRFVGMTLALEEDRVVVTVVDFGKPSAPRETVTEEVVDDFSKRLRRGRGRLLIRKLMDDVEYETMPGVQNKLVMVKYRRRDFRGGFVSVME